jgi:hypothetical protein
MNIVFQFEGGFLDGKVVAGDTDPHKSGGEAQLYLMFTHGGLVGTRFPAHHNPLGGTDLLSAFLREIEQLALKPKWWSRWLARILTTGTPPESLRQELASYLADRGQILPRTSIPIEEFVRGLRTRSRQFRDGAQIYEVISCDMGRSEYAWRWWERNNGNSRYWFGLSVPQRRISCTLVHPTI